MKERYDKARKMQPENLLGRAANLAPVPVFTEDGVYYMITSGCTGWDPNNALFGTSKNIFSGWKLIGDPCTGENARQTYFGQSTYIFEKDGVHYLMLDHWKPDDLQMSGYSILPIQTEKGHLTIAFQEYTDL